MILPYSIIQVTPIFLNHSCINQILDWTIKIFGECIFFKMELSLKYEVKSSPELSKSLQKDLIVNKLNNFE